MENTDYKVLARKYRPQTFSELMGQDVLVQTLTNSIKNNRVHHAFILTGIRGVGKTTTARIIAKSLNCVGEDGNGLETITPCLKCHHCRAIANSLDQDVIEFDAASNTGVEKIRDLIENINYAPVNARYKVYIIDEVHMLSNSAFNALLKTIEEPPARVKFIFATTEIRKVPITILSRCIRFDLNRVPDEILSSHLIDIAAKEKYELDKTASSLISRASEGSVRDSLSILDRVISFNNFSSKISEETAINILGLGGKESVYELYSSLLRKDSVFVVNKFHDIYNSLVNIDTFLSDLLDITHILLMEKNGVAMNNLSTFQREWLKNNKDLVDLGALFRIWQFVIKASEEIRNVVNVKNFVDVLLIKICFGLSLPEVSDLIKKLKNKSVDLTSPKKEDLTNLATSIFSGAKMI